MPQVKFAHVGILVKDLDAAARIMAELFGCTAAAPAADDPVQEARLLMLESAGTLLELIAPASDQSKIHTMLKHRGEGPVHLCFETDDMQTTLAAVRKGGGMVFKGPDPAILFGGKQVAFALLPNRMMVEFVETGWREGMKQP
jgi:methylmalonyl-CoA/ethylmalonyl-CoA epimerase